MAHTKKAKLATTTVEAVIADAFAELTTLGEEMRSWADNMPENMQSGSKYDEVTSAADTLEGLQEPDMSEIPDEVKNKEVTYQKATKTSRAARRDEATGMLSAAAEALREAAEDYNEPEDPKGADESDEAVADTIQKAEDTKEAVTTLADEVTELQEEADGVQFPGMY